MTDNDRIVISNKLIALISLVILLPMQIACVVLWPLVVLMILWRYRHDNFVMGGQRLKWRLLVALAWPGLMFWEFYDSNNCFRVTVENARL